MDGGGAWREARIALGGVGPTPIRATQAERLLQGRKPKDALLSEAGEEVARISRPVSDIRGTSEYKREMVCVHVKRALKQCLRMIRAR